MPGVEEFFRPPSLRTGIFWVQSYHMKGYSEVQGYLYPNYNCTYDLLRGLGGLVSAVIVGVISEYEAPCTFFVP